MGNVLSPVDAWTSLHGLSGFFIGRIKVGRLLAYTMTVVWEVYQLYFHYQPQDKGLEYIWLNSVVDILAFVVSYEIAVKHSLGYDKNKLWRMLSDNIKALLTYLLITCATAWLFWDDMFCLRLAARMPSSQTALLLGAFSPVIASFLVSRWIGHARFINGQPSLALRERLFYLFAFGLFPSVTVYGFMKQVIILPH